MEVSLLAFIQGCVIESLGYNSKFYESLLTSVIFAGQIVGMLTLGPLADVYGRRPVLIAGWAVIVVFGLLSSFSPGIWSLIVFRTFVGFGIGSSQGVAYDLYVELIPRRSRSTFVYISALGVVGQFYLLSAAWLLLASDGWRYVVFASALPIALIAPLGLVYMHESPRWLLSQGRVEEAETIVHHMCEVNGKSKSSLRLQRVTAADPAVQVPRVWSRPLRSLTARLWAVWTLVNFSYYCVYLSIVDSVESTADACSYGFGFIMLACVLSLAGTLVAASAVDNFGRVRVIFAALVASALLVLIYVFTSSLAPLLLALAAVVMSTSSLGVFTVESYPTDLRATGYSLACVAAKVGAFLSVYYIDDFEDVKVDAGTVTYIVFIFVAAGLIFPLKVCPSLVSLLMTNDVMIGSGHQRRLARGLVPGI